MIQIHLLYESKLSGQLGLIISLELNTFRLIVRQLLLVLVLILLVLLSVLILWLTVLHILYHLLLIENRVYMIHLIELLHLVVIFLHPIFKKITKLIHKISFLLTFASFMHHDVH